MYSRTSVNVGETTWSVDAETARGALDERGLPRAELAGQRDDVAGRSSDARPRPRARVVGGRHVRVDAHRNRSSGTRAGRATSPSRAQNRPSCSSGAGSGAAAARSSSARRISAKSSRSDSHLLRRLAAAVQDRRRVERRDHRSPVQREALAPDPADRHLLGPARTVSRSSRACTITAGSISRELLVQPRRARLDLVGQRVAVARGAALHDVRDVDVVAASADLLEHRVQQLAGGADERDRPACPRGSPGPRR